MTSLRFDRPGPGAVVSPRFPPIAREVLDNGLAVWTLVHDAVPLTTVALVLPRGAAADPALLPGLASLTGDLLDEGAGSRDAIGVAEAFSRIGSHLDIDVGSDATTLSFSGLTRVLADGLDLLADVVCRPRFAASDFDRVRDLRVGRLRQMSRSASAAADRALAAAVFGSHPYGHGTMGTTEALERMAVDDTRRFWGETFSPIGATMIVGGAIDPADAIRAVLPAFGAWDRPAPLAEAHGAVAPAPDRRVHLVDRPGAPQSELRIGHVGPTRHSASYHALVTLNAVVGGQFTSRINKRLREERAITYGAHTSFDFRKMSGVFSCDTSVESEATATAVADVLAEFERVRTEPVGEAELDAARASLTRGYVRHFETSTQWARAATQLATYELPDETFSRFVPEVEAVTSARILEVATAAVRPHDAAIVVVGDASRISSSLEALGREIVAATPAF